MRLFRKLAALMASAVFATAIAAGPVVAEPITALSRADADAYSSAFQLAAQGEFDAAEQATTRAADKSLLGYIQFQKLMWPATKATYVQLKSWLGVYADMPGAERILSLAKKRKPRGEPDMVLPPSGLDAAPASLAPPSSSRGRAAREAYYSGNVKSAYSLAIASGERWIAGLSAYRLNNFTEAMNRFQSVAQDTTQNEWIRAGGAFWAARAAVAAGQPERAPDFLTLAARSPQTFYGMLAERQLGLEPGADPQAYALAQAGFAPSPSELDGQVVKASYTALSGPVLARMLANEPRARRAVALSQIGHANESGLELRAGLAAAQSEADRQLWTTLAIQLNNASAAEAQSRRMGRFNPDDYPTPKLEPDGGFTLDKALVYAVVRQESRFDPYIVSGSGAIGLMQLMPPSAAEAAGDDNILSNALPLFDPPTNLRIGQDYLDKLIQQYAHGDVMAAVAAFNGGPGALLRAQKNVGVNDPLLVIESMPAAQTRDYVEKVMANYWIYRRLFGEGNRTLDQVAGATPDGKSDPG